VIKNLCYELGVYTEPMCISGVWIAPIYSWYHASFDREPDLPGAPAVEKVSRLKYTPSAEIVHSLRHVPSAILSVHSVIQPSRHLYSNSCSQRIALLLSQRHDWADNIHLIV